MCEVRARVFRAVKNSGDSKFMTVRRLAFLSVLLAFPAVLHAGEPLAVHKFLCCDYNGNQVCIVAEDGTIEWRYEAHNPQDCWQMPSGNILFCYLYGAKEET